MKTRCLFLVLSGLVMILAAPFLPAQETVLEKRTGAAALIATK